jgi:hypothetical protein
VPPSYAMNPMRQLNHLAALGAGGEVGVWDAAQCACVQAFLSSYLGLSKISTETETTTTRRLAVFASGLIGVLLSLLLTFPTGGRLALICSAPGNILDHVYSTAGIKYAYAAFSHPLILLLAPPRLLISLHLPPYKPSFLVACYFRLLTYSLNTLETVRLRYPARVDPPRGRGDGRFPLMHLSRDSFLRYVPLLYALFWLIKHLPGNLVHPTFLQRSWMDVQAPAAAPPN